MTILFCNINSNRFILLLLCCVLLFVVPKQVKAQTYTLQEVLEYAQNFSPEAMKNKTSKENKYWQWRTYKSNYKPQLVLFKKLTQLGNLWADTGVRCTDDIIDPIVADVNKVVISTKTLSNFNELFKAFELSEQIILGIDYDNGIINHGSRLNISL